jgi:uncharacterized protein
MHTLQQEIEVWYIIPAIRRELSKCLIKDFNVSYDKIGSILGISKAAVSQYVKEKRAAKIKLHKKTEPEIMKSCKLLINNKSDSVSEITRILEFIKTKDLPIEVCDKHTKGVLENCRVISLHGMKAVM